MLKRSCDTRSFHCSRNTFSRIGAHPRGCRWIYWEAASCSLRPDIHGDNVESRTSSPYAPCIMLSSACWHAIFRTNPWKQRDDTNTPFFRGALTIGGNRDCGLGRLLISEYRSETERLNSSRFYQPDYLTDDCRSQQLDPSSDDWRWRDPTSEEVQSCLSTAQEIHTRSIESSSIFEFKRA